MCTSWLLGQMAISVGDRHDFREAVAWVPTLPTSCPAGPPHAWAHPLNFPTAISGPWSCSSHHLTALAQAVHVCTDGSAQYVSEGQRATESSEFFPSTMWVHCVGRAWQAMLSHPTGPFCNLEKGITMQLSLTSNLNPPPPQPLRFWGDTCVPPHPVLCAVHHNSFHYPPELFQETQAVKPLSTQYSNISFSTCLPHPRPCLLFSS